MNARNSFRSQQYSQRYNNTGTFVPAAQNAPPSQNKAPQNQNYQPQQQLQQQWQTSEITPNVEESPPNIDTSIPMQEDPSTDNFNPGDETEGNGIPRKKWPKRGFKVSMREKRRRQNKQLRRLLTPKNALMVLNELTPGSQNECTVVAEGESAFGMAVNRNYIASLNVGGQEYRGTGPSKLLAKNHAAENVIRDMIIKQMGKVPNPDGISTEDEKMEDDDKPDEQTFPMIQLASYALHKLFSEWQSDGFKVPQMTPNKPGEQSTTSSVSGVQAPPKARKVPTLPNNPQLLHPCMLLSQMRLGLEYTFLSSEEIKPNSQIFSMGVTVDGTTFVGKAANKKEARKQAAKKACEELFQITYPEEVKTEVAAE